MEVFTLKSDKIVKSSNIKHLSGGNLIKDTSNWVRMVSPSLTEIEEVSELVGIDIEEFTDFMEDDERSRVEQGKFLQIIYRAPFSEKDEINTVSFCMFFRNKVLVTIEKERVYVFEKYAAQFKRNKNKALLKNSIGEFMQEIFDNVNDQFLSSIQQIGTFLKKQRVYYEENSEKQLRQIYNSNIALSHFNHALVANLEVLNALRKSKMKVFSSDDRGDFGDLYYDVLQIIDTCKIERDVLSTMFNFQTILSSYRLNTYMKRLTGLALIIAIPTLISSVYGMNVINLPFANQNYGFLFLTSFMIVLSFAIAYVFNKLDWI